MDTLGTRFPQVQLLNQEMFKLKLFSFFFFLNKKNKKRNVSVVEC